MPLSSKHPQQAFLYLARSFFHQSLSTVDHFCQLSATFSKVNSQITLLPLSNIKYQSPNLPVTCKGRVSSNLLSKTALTTVSFGSKDEENERDTHTQFHQMIITHTQAHTHKLLLSALFVQCARASGVLIVIGGLVPGESYFLQEAVSPPNPRTEIVTRGIGKHLQPFPIWSHILHV